MSIKDVLRYELIGLPVKIVASKNTSLVGIEGVIVDETKYLVIIESAGKVKKILKEQATFHITFNDRTYEIQGKLLIGRPEERLKKVRL